MWDKGRVKNKLRKKKKKGQSKLEKNRISKKKKTENESRVLGNNSYTGLGKCMSVIKKQSYNILQVLLIFYCLLQPIHFMLCCECREQVEKGS